MAILVLQWIAFGSVGGLVNILDFHFSDLTRGQF